MTCSSAICSISFQKNKPFETIERLEIERELSAFVKPFSKEILLDATLASEDVLQTTFACSISALSAIHNHLYHTMRYDEQYSVAIDFNQL